MTGYTPIYNLPYPQASDLVSAYPGTGQDLAEEVETVLAAKLGISGGKILQIVRATDTTNRSTTSTSMVDANISVTITPQYATSAVLLIYSAYIQTNATSGSESRFDIQITDSANTGISGAQLARSGAYGLSSANYGSAQSLILVGYATPATTSATTYKVRYQSRASAVTTTISNGDQTSQLLALEVSA